MKLAFQLITLLRTNRLIFLNLNAKCFIKYFQIKMDDEMISNESKSILTSPNKEVQKYNVIQNEYDQEYFKDFDR